MTINEFKNKFVIQNIIRDSNGIGYLKGTKIDEDAIISYITELESLITELEAPKACYSCKYVHETKNDPNFQGLSCTKTEMCDMEENFYCSYYELKDDK